MILTKRVFTHLIIILFISGCTYAYEREMKNNNNNLLLLDVGVSKKQVMKIMGPPRLNEAYKSNNSVPTVIWFYYTNTRINDGIYSKKEMTPLVFEHGKLVGWGDEFYESKQIIEVRHR